MPSRPEPHAGLFTVFESPEGETTATADLSTMSIVWRAVIAVGLALVTVVGFAFGATAGMGGFPLDHGATDPQVEGVALAVSMAIQGSIYATGAFAAGLAIVGSVWAIREGRRRRASASRAGGPEAP